MRPVEATYGILGDNRTAVIEMATASGLTLVPDVYKRQEMEISWICIIMARSSLRRSPVPMINVLRPLANSEEKVYLCVGICGLYAMTLMR